MGRITLPEWSSSRCGGRFKYKMQRDMNRPMLGPCSSPKYAKTAQAVAGLSLPGGSRPVTPLDRVFVPTYHDMLWHRGGGAPGTPTYPVFSPPRRLHTPLIFPARGIVDRSQSRHSDWDSLPRTDAGMMQISADLTKLQQRSKSLNTERQMSMVRTRMLFPKRMHHTKKELKVSKEVADNTAQMNEIADFALRIT